MQEHDKTLYTLAIRVIDAAATADELKSIIIEIGLLLTILFR